MLLRFLCNFVLLESDLLSADLRVPHGDEMRISDSMSGDAHQHCAGPIWHQQPGIRKATAQLHDAHRHFRVRVLPAQPRSRSLSVCRRLMWRLRHSRCPEKTQKSDGHYSYWPRANLAWRLNRVKLSCPNLRLKSWVRRANQMHGCLRVNS